MTTLRDKIKDCVAEYFNDEEIVVFDEEVLVNSICEEIKTFIGRMTD